MYYALVWSTVTTVPLYKTSQREEDKFWPVGVAPTMVRLLDKFAAVQNRQVLQDYLEPQQLALSLACLQGGTSWCTLCAWWSRHTGAGSAAN